MPIQILPDPLSLLRPVSKVITSSRTRPANATAYASGQILSDSTTAATMMSFPGCARANGLGGLLDLRGELIDRRLALLRERRHRREHRGQQPNASSASTSPRHGDLYCFCPPAGGESVGAGAVAPACSAALFNAWSLAVVMS